MLCRVSILGFTSVVQTGHLHKEEKVSCENDCCFRHKIKSLFLLLARESPFDEKPPQSSTWNCSCFVDKKYVFTMDLSTWDSLTPETKQRVMGGHLGSQIDQFAGIQSTIS